jgi:8-oxo-dGTP pyrophosphatase MutT (NUDIX family)
MSYYPSNPDAYTHVINPKLFKRQATTSYSVIVHTLINGEIKYLLGRVRDTIPFREFLRCSIKEPEIMRYLQHLSQEEKYRLLHESFQTLLDDVFINRNSRLYRAACEMREQFTTNLARYRPLLTDPTLGLPEAPWLFPKGRKQEHEAPSACALREFEEETHISQAAIKLYDADPLEETYFGLDGQIYKTIYFMGFLNYDDFKAMTAGIRTQFILTPSRVSLSEEIAKIKWLDYHEAIEKLDPAKQYILRLVNNYLIFQLSRDFPLRRQSI